MSSTSKEMIAAALRQHGCEPTPAGNGYRAKCPCHDGDSMTVLAVSEDGKIFCHKCGANTGDVLRKLGLKDSKHRSARPKLRIDGKDVTLHPDEQSAIDGVSWSVAKLCGSSQRKPDRLHRYHNSDGDHVGTVALWKVSPDRKETRQIRRVENGWVCKAMLEPRPLYSLPDILNANSVTITEGEKDADKLQSIGIVATSPTQGAKSPGKSDWSVLAGKSVTVSVDNDQAGREFGKLVLDMIRDIAAEVRVVELKDDWPDLPEKGDAADWVGHFADVEYSELRKRFQSLPDRTEEIDEIVPTKKTRKVVFTGGRPKIEVTLDEKSVNDQVIAKLAKRGDIYDHSGKLAVVIDEQSPCESPQKAIRKLCLSNLRETISETCLFFQITKDSEGNEEESLLRIPRWCYEATITRGYWPNIRSIRGIVNSPILRADGSILQTQGYDGDSGIYADLTESFPTINEHPAPEDVQNAIAILFDVVSDFPFRDDAGRSAWLASLLTPLAREAYRGCTGPLFLFDANVRGSGKSLLGDINALIVTGREATRLSSPRDDEEARKRITALVCSNDQIVMIDNIVGRFGSAAFDAALTGTTWKDRRLGHSEMMESPLRMAWYASGNNVILAADTARRVCHVRLESPLENPEDRSGFKYPDIRKYVRQNRPKLLTAALTILRGYIAAECPNQKLKPWGSFEGWSDLVRAAISFAGQVDPGETRTELRATSDSEAGALRQMLLSVQQVDQDEHGLKTSDILKIATNRDPSYSNQDSSDLQDAVESFCGFQISKVSAQRLGSRLSHFRNRVIDEMSFDCSVKRGANYWFVVSSGGRGVCGGPVSAESYASVSLVTTETHKEKRIPAPGENRSTTSTTSTPDTEWAAGAFE